MWPRCCSSSGWCCSRPAQRYLPIDGWPWTGELARFCLVWLTFVVAGVLVTNDSHISIEMIDMVPGVALRRVVRVLSCLIVAVIGVGLCAEAWELMQTQGILKSPAMQMPMSWLYAISLIGFVSVVVRSLIAAVQYAVLGVPEPTLRRPGDADSMSVLVLCLLITALLVIRVPVAFAFFGPCLLYMITTDQSVGLALRLVANSTASFPLLAVPLFILLGSIANHAGIADRLFDFALALLGRVRGSLGYVSVGVSLGFSWMSGSAVADAAALGKVEIPAMLRAGYSRPFALGVVGSSSLIAPVMPPSIPAVIYAGLAGVSTGALFAASVVPALLMAVGLCVVVFLWVRRMPNLERTEFSWDRVWETGRRVIAPLGAPVIILGGILGGYVTPTEAAAVGALYMLLLGLRLPHPDGPRPAQGAGRGDADHRQHHADRRLGEPARLRLRPRADPPGHLGVDARPHQQPDRLPAAGVRALDAARHRARRDRRAHPDGADPAADRAAVRRRPDRPRAC